MFDDSWLAGHYVEVTTPMRRIQRILADETTKSFIGIHRLDPPHPRHNFDIVVCFYRAYQTMSRSSVAR
jgi:hypothetical protein